MNTQNEQAMHPPGVVIDRSPDAKRVFVGCPSIAILPSGAYAASHSWFGPGTTMDTTALFISRDEGANWETAGEIKGQFWSTLFVHNGQLYIMGVDSRYGRVVIRGVENSLEKWTEPIDSDTGLLMPDTEYHTAPVPVVVHNGRIWRAFERREPADGWCNNFHPFVMSAAVDADLLKAKSWRVSDSPGRFQQKWRSLITREEARNTSRAGEHEAFNPENGWLEGNIVITPEDGLVDILRVHEPFEGETAAVARVSSDGRKLTFDPANGFVRLPGGCIKFTIRHDPVSNRYWALTNFVHNQDRGFNAERTRNTLGLAVSPDLRKWDISRQILHEHDRDNTGFQYVDWLFNGGDIIAVSRTAFGDSDNSHNANYLTFHRVPNFRKLP